MDNHNAFYQDFAELLKKHAQNLSSVEILAIASNSVGKLLALQDQNAHSVDQYMQIIARNIEIGNQEVVSQLLNNTGGNA